MFTLYSSDYTGNPGNCYYPHRHTVTDLDSLRAAVGHDYVCAEYRNSYRSNDNFIGTDCLPVDCDNDHSENPNDWVMPTDVQAAFPGVTFAVHYSRSHMREKNGKAARPKFHVLFPIEPMTDAVAYSNMKKLVSTVFPYFDTNALDAARFFFGTAGAEAELYEGTLNLTAFFEDDFDADMPSRNMPAVIREGSRNATLSRFVGRVIKKYGNTDEAYRAFLEQAAKCEPPLDSKELATVWRRNSLTVSAGRTDISRRRLTIRMFPTSPATTRMSDRQRCWQSIFPANSDTPPPPILSDTMHTTGRKANRVRRRSSRRTMSPGTRSDVRTI